MKFQRKAIELAKMIKRLHLSRTPFVIAHGIDGGYDIGLDIYNFKTYPNGMGLYDAMKDFYFVEELGIDNSENIVFDLDEDVLEFLYEKADKQNKLVDEIIIEVLEDIMEKLKLNNCEYGDGI